MVESGEVVAVSARRRAPARSAAVNRATQNIKCSPRPGFAAPGPCAGPHGHGRAPPRARSVGARGNAIDTWRIRTTSRGDFEIYLLYHATHEYGVGFQVRARHIYCRAEA